MKNWDPQKSRLHRSWEAGEGKNAITICHNTLWINSGRKRGLSLGSGGWEADGINLFPVSRSRPQNDNNNWRRQKSTPFATRSAATSWFPPFPGQPSAPVFVLCDNIYFILFTFISVCCLLMPRHTLLPGNRRNPYAISYSDPLDSAPFGLQDSKSNEWSKTLIGVGGRGRSLV